MSENVNECTHNCSSCSQDCSERKPESLLEKPHELSNIKNVIAVVSGKGGVGKSMVTSMLAVTMARRGYKSAILDADVTGPSIPKLFGIKEKAQGDNLGLYPVRSKTGIPIMSVNLLLENEEDPVVWRGPIIGGTVKQFWTDVIWSDVDFMFVDMPPGTGDVPLTVFQSIPVNGIIVVTTPQDLVSMIVSKALKMAQLMNIPLIGLVENMSYFTCPDCGKIINVFGQSHIDAVSKKFGIDILAKIPIYPDLTKAADSGLIELYEGDWLDKACNKIEK